MAIRLYSFDVFDTLITRKTATCNGIFVLMRDKLMGDAAYKDIPEHLKKNFFPLRKQCEMVARNTYIHKGWQDVTLSQIYQCIKTTLGLNESQKERLEQLEISVEYDNSVAICENIEKVNQLVQGGNRVVLVSNMYLPECVIRKMLLKHSPIFADMTIYVSCEYGKTKGSGQLYRYVCGKEEVSFEEWKHFGDDLDLDIKKPNSLGMQTEQCRVPQGMPWEQYYLKEREENIEVQLAIAPSLMLQREKNTHSYSYFVGSSYSAPILYPYVRWVLERSIQGKIETLFFIARDGYILKKMADYIIREEGLNIQTEYLYGSRKAWRLPAVSPDTFDMKEFLKWDYSKQFYSYREIAEIFEFSMEELKQFLPFATDEDVELGWRYLDKVYDFMAEHQKAFAQYISEKQKKNRHNAVSYLNQELSRAKGKYAFVDLIGSGYTQKCLASLLGNEKPILTFYYRLDSCREYPGNTNYAFYPNRQELGNIIEVLCRAQHGQTVGYREEKNTWVPVLGKEEEGMWETYGYHEYQQGIMEYTKMYGQMGTYRCGENSLDIPRFYFQFLAERRDAKLYDYIMDIPYGTSGREKRVQSFAPRLSNGVLRKIYLTHTGENTRKYYEGYHLEFALLRLSANQKKRVNLYKKWSQGKTGRLIHNITSIFSHGRRFDHEYYMIAKNIVLYGAGKRGQLLYRQLTEGKKFGAKIILWVDRNYIQYQKQGLKVCSVDALSEVEYEQIVIAMKEEKVADEIKRELAARGIHPWKIIWIVPRANL